MTLLVELKNRVAKGNCMYPTTIVEAHNLAQKWRTTRPRSMKSSKPVAVYVAQNQGGRKNGKAGRGEAGNAGGHIVKGGRGGAGNAEGHICNSDRGQVQNNQPRFFSQKFRGKSYIWSGDGERKRNRQYVDNVLIRMTFENVRTNNTNLGAIFKITDLGCY
jgi:hypothetical protein